MRAHFVFFIKRSHYSLVRLTQAFGIAGSLRKGRDRRAEMKNRMRIADQVRIIDVAGVAVASRQEEDISSV